ncbi:hypothetical protein N9Q15_02275 [Amylibacter sp.]|nr:hypothetical protein [Amylibacter sp.]
MKLFLGIKGHANTESLPLRYGLQIQETHQQFCTLHNAIHDVDGTKTQRQNEIEKGRKHYLGKLEIKEIDPNKYYKIFETRCVIEETKDQSKLSPIVTLLRDGSRSDLATTQHIGNMVKRGKLDVKDIIEFLHPEYIDGNIRDSTDVEEIYQEKILPSRQGSQIELEGTGLNTSHDLPKIKESIESIPDDESSLSFPPTFKKLELSSSVKYKYSMADAFVEDVWMDNGKIYLKVIGSSDENKTLHSFKQRSHLVVHHQKTFEYLKSRIGQRAIFAVCMSEPCKGFLAESVTSIALQIMKQ